MNTNNKSTSTPSWRKNDPAQEAATNENKKATLEIDSTIKDPASVVANDYDYDQEHQDGDDSTNVIANIYRGGSNSVVAADSVEISNNVQRKQRSCRWAGISLMLLGLALATAVIVVWWLVLEQQQKPSNKQNDGCDTATADLYRRGDGVYYERVAIACPNDNNNSNNTASGDNDKIWLDVSAEKIADVSEMAQRIPEYCRQLCFV